MPSTDAATGSASGERIDAIWESERTADNDETNMT